MTFALPVNDDLEKTIVQSIESFFYDALSEEAKDSPATTDPGYRALASAIAARLRKWNTDGEVLTLSTTEPEQWRFFDLGTGSVWQWVDGELKMVGMAMMAEVSIPGLCAGDHGPDECCCGDDH